MIIRSIRLLAAAVAVVAAAGVLAPSGATAQAGAHSTFETRLDVGAELPLSVQDPVAGPAWLEWEAPVDGVVEFTGRPHRVYAVIDGDLGPRVGGPVGADFGYFRSRVPVVSGERYAIDVRADYVGLRIEYVGPQAVNDDPNGAIDLGASLPAIAPDVVGVGTVGALTNRYFGWDGEPVWWSWTAESNTTVVVQTDDGRHQVWRSGDERGPRSVGSGEFHMVSGDLRVESSIVFVRAGETILIQADRARRTVVARRSTVPPANDDAADAADLGSARPDELAVVFGASTLEEFEPTGPDGSVWFALDVADEESLRFSVPAPWSVEVWEEDGEGSIAPVGPNLVNYVLPGEQRRAFVRVSGPALPAGQSLYAPTMSIEALDPPTNIDRASATVIDLADGLTVVDTSLADSPAYSRWWVVRPSTDTLVRIERGDGGAFLGIEGDARYASSFRIPDVFVPGGGEGFIVITGSPQRTTAAFTVETAGTGTSDDPYRPSEIGRREFRLPLGSRTDVHVAGPPTEGYSTSVVTTEIRRGDANVRSTGVAVQSRPDGSEVRRDTWDGTRRRFNVAVLDGLTTTVQIDVPENCSECELVLSDEVRRAANDDRDMAMPITDPLPAQVSTNPYQGATIEIDDPVGDDPELVSTFWWSFTAPSAGAYDIVTSVTSTVGPDGGDVDDAALRHTVAMAAGETYLIQTWGSGTVWVNTSGVVTCAGLPATIVGSAGNDSLVGTAGPDVIVAFGGDDQIEGRAGDDVICAGPGDDKISGGDGADLIRAGSGDDVIDTGNGADRSDAGSGDDRFVGPEGDATIDGGPGGDWLSYSSRVASVYVDLSVGTLRHRSVTTAVSGIEHVVGSPSRDTLVGDDNNNHLIGGGRADMIDGRGGNDVIDIGGGVFNDADGGDGVDTISFRSVTGTDGVVVDLDAGTAEVNGSAAGTIRGFERVEGSRFSDTLLGSDGPEVLRGGFGDDVIDGRGGSDRLLGGSGDDACADDPADERRIWCETTIP